MQEGNWARINATTGKRVTVGELHGFALGYPRARCIFRFPRESWFPRDVLPFLQERKRRE